MSFHTFWIKIYYFHFIFLERRNAYPYTFIILYSYIFIYLFLNYIFISFYLILQIQINYKLIYINTKDKCISYSMIMTFLETLVLIYSHINKIYNFWIEFNYGHMDCGAKSEFQIHKYYFIGLAIILLFS